MLFYKVNLRDTICITSLIRMSSSGHLILQIVCYKVLVFFWDGEQGEVDDTALDVNFSGNVSFDKVLHRYMPEYLNLGPLKLGDLTGETKISGALLNP